MSESQAEKHLWSIRKKVVLKEKWLFLASMVYIYVPLMVFFIGFTRPIVWIVIALFVAFVLYRVYTAVCKGEFACGRIEVQFFVIIIGVFILLLTGYFASWGRWVKQTGDWFKHNAVLKDLVERRWPVYYSNGNEKSMLTYYLGQYLVPALVGKLVGSLRSAEIGIYFWNEIGLILVWFYLLIYMRKTKTQVVFWGLFCLLFFHTPQCLAEVIAYLFSGVDNLYTNSFNLYNGDIIIQYSGHFGLLSWVFPQAIVPWLVTVIFLQNKSSIKYYLVYMLPMMLFAVLPMLGLVPLAVGYFLFECFKKKRERKFQEAISIENVLCLISYGTALLLYYYGNVFEPKPERLSFRLLNYGEHISILLIFIICNVLIYAICIFKDYKRNPLFYLAFGLLTVLPLFSMGYYNDLVMRSSIPALFIVMTMVSEFIASNFGRFIDTINELKRKRTLTVRRMMALVSFIVLIGVFVNAVQYQLIMFNNKVKSEDYINLGIEKNYGSLEYFANRRFALEDQMERKLDLANTFPETKELKIDLMEDLVYNYYSYDIDENLFVRYLAK